MGSQQSKLLKIKPHLQQVLHSRAESIARDPIFFPLKYENPVDQEFAAFLAAHFAFGNVRSVCDHLTRIYALSQGSLMQWFGSRGFKRDLESLQYRWIHPQDHVAIGLGLRAIAQSKRSLESIFKGSWQPHDMRKSLQGFARSLRAIFGEHHPSGMASRGIKFFISTPSPQSVSKRSNLFLRWMVRTQAPDLGLWRNSLRPDQLLMPIDTHVARIANYIGLTQQKKVNWQMLEDIGQALKYLDPQDPIKYDFALAHLGIDRNCRHRFVADICGQCRLHPICRIGKRAAEHV